ncbi:MAG: hypothetical protein JWM63_5362 [Gammaproteobacteria bacterium]|jgi:hypothetical protein|nr:hypothetical protein [Gammaproteobacteria bacterium]
MTKSSEDGSAGFRGAADEDTIELELSPEQMLALSRPMREEQPASSPVESTPISTPVEPASPNRYVNVRNGTRTGTWPLARAAGALGIAAAALALGSAAHRAADRSSSPPAVTTRAPTSAAPAAPEPAGSQSLPVRFKNPFDASEIFEFPPGTSEGEARQSVAELLLQRAHDRQHHRSGGMKRARGDGAAPGIAASSADLVQNSSRAAH